MLLEPTSERAPNDGATGRPPEALTPEALIPEARARTRRRRWRWGSLLVVLGAALAGVYAIVVPGGPGVIAGTADSPYANLRALRGHGQLAFVSRRQLWVLDGARGTLRHLPVPAGEEAQDPTFSHDGHWLAYVVRSTDPNYQGTFQLWMARADGSGAHRVAGVALRDLVGWSPRADVLAATVGQQTRQPPIGYATAVDLVSAPGRVRTLLSAPGPSHKGRIDAVGGALWSPAGSSLAVELQGGLSSRIETVSATSRGIPTIWLAAGSRPVRVAGITGRGAAGLIPQLAGWWPHWGIAFWVIDGGAVDNRDSTPLAVINAPGARPRYLAQTLSLGITDAVASGPDGKLALVASTTNAGREFADGKEVEICSAGAAGAGGADGAAGAAGAGVAAAGAGVAAAGAGVAAAGAGVAAAGCRPVPAATSWPDAFKQRCPCYPAHTIPGRPGSGVSEDPSWSPDGAHLAYVKAPTTDNSAWPSNSWFAQHAVYVWSARTGTTRRIGRVDGSALPTWSGDGRDLMYESGDALWLVPLSTGKPVELVHPLYALSAWNNRVSHLGWISYYGQIPWKDQFSWWSPSH